MPVTSELSEAKRSLLGKYHSGKIVLPASRILPRKGGVLAPLTFSQEELWRREQRVPEIPPLYNECVTVRMRGQLDVTALERALTAILARHEIWRTTFETKGGVPVQVVQPPAPLKLRTLDLRGLREDLRQSEALRLMDAEAARPFRLAEEPPLRPILVRTDDQEHRLYLIAHQIILDGPSAYQIFPFELAAFYKGFTTGASPMLAELQIQCSDFALWQREQKNVLIEQQLEYWRKRLGDDHSLSQWPLRLPQTGRSYRGVIQSFAFSAETRERIRLFSHRENGTLFSTLLAGFAALLHSKNKQEKIFLGTLSPSGRKRSEVLGLLGYFLNPVALKFDFASEPTLVDLIHQARHMTAEAICNDDVPIEHVARQLKSANTSPSPFFRAAVSLQPPTPDLGVDWAVSSMDVQSGGSPWELYLAFIDRPTGLLGRAQFDPTIFDPEAISHLLKELESLILCECSSVLKELPPLRPGWVAN